MWLLSLMLAADALSPKLIAEACRGGGACVQTCSGDKGDEIVASIEGAFTAPGAAETMVSFQPCRNPAGLGTWTALVRRAPKLQRVAVGKDGFSGECSVVHLAGRDVVACNESWGPVQGITGQNFCVTWYDGHRVQRDCPVRVTDTSGGEFDCDTPGKNQQATIASWKVSGGGVRVAVDYEDCKAPDQSPHLELAISFDPSGRPQLSAKDRALLDKLDTVIDVNHVSRAK